VFGGDCGNETEALLTWKYGLYLIQTGLEFGVQYIILVGSMFIRR